MSENKNSLVCISGVRGYEEDGVANLHIEDVARGLGFTRIKESGNEIVRWDRVDSYLNDLKFVGPTCGPDENPHDYYIPENIFYRLCMKARNDVAEAFQAKVADEIIPSIRKTGSYSVTQTQVSRKDQLYLTIIHAESEAVRVDALKELAEINKQEVKALTAERDEAIRTKAMIGSSREATAMATASAKARECKRLETENGLLKQDFVTNKDFCAQLLAQGLVVYAENTLQGKCSKALKELTALMEKKTLNWNEWCDKAGREVPRTAYHKDVCAELKQRIIDNPKYLRRFK